MKNVQKIIVIGLTAAFVMAAVTACGAKKETAAETLAPTTAAETVAETEAPKAETQTQPETVKETQAETQAETAAPDEEKTYESKDGWKIKYFPKVFAMTEGDNGEVSFSYQGDAAGSNVITISYHKGKMPSEVLYDKTANVDDSRVTRSEGWFGGTYPAWTFSRDIAPDKNGSGLGERYVGIEHNGGTLLVDILYHADPDEERNMDTSDNISGLLDSLELVNHKPQEEMAHHVGTFVREYKEEMEGQEQTFTDTITLNEDHTGMMSFQDDIEIIWSSIELIERYGDAKYEYTIEGDSLLLNMNPGSDWLRFEKIK